MRAPLLAILLLAPALAAASPAPAPLDLIVTLREGAALDPPARALPLATFPGFVLLDASADELRRLAADPRVERVDVAKPLERHGAPTLPASAHHGLTRTLEARGTGRGVTVAVVDSGVDATHPDLAGRVKANVKLVDRAFVPSVGDLDGHGTHVAGILAASGATSQGRWRGVAPDAELVGIDISGRFTTASALLAYEWLAANRARFGIDVVVNAWGRIPDGEAFDPRDPEIRAIDALVASGVVVLFSASNRGPVPGSLSLEAMDPHVITVGATDASGQLMAYSSRGPASGGATWIKPDVVAPGETVVSARATQSPARAEDPDALHATYSGTSQAVPHVAGIVALLLEADPTLTPHEIATALRSSAIDLAAPGPDHDTGFGLVDAIDALRIAGGLPPERGNLLITGGRHVQRDEADLAEAPRRGLLDLVSRREVVWETLFAIPIGAERARVSVSANGAPMQVELAHAGRLVRAAQVEDPAPGVWLLRARGDLPAPARAVALIETDLPPEPARALVQDGRASAPPPTLAPIDEEPALLWLPLGIWALSGATLAYAIMPRRKPPA